MLYKDKTPPDYIPLSMMNAFAYCPRRFYYEFVLAEMVVNEFVLEGSQLHERVDEVGVTTNNGKLQLHRIYLCAPKLGLLGYCDLVEAVKSETSVQASLTNEGLADLARAGRLYPVEYKKGKMGQWLADHVQLCAQALALEEVLDVPVGSITHGYVFYFGSQHREEVQISAGLRADTLQLLANAKEVATKAHLPSPIRNWKKCQDCSLQPICLPREVLSFEAKVKRMAKD